MNILITGCAGFIGSALSKQLLERGDTVIGIDNINDYYDVNLKLARLELIRSHDAFHFYQYDITDYSKLNSVFESNKIDRVIHLAAQAGVRYSLENPFAYIDANIQGFINVLEACRHSSIGHLVYASSSSVYGANTSMPFSTQDNVDHPISLYAATKKSNELMAHTYSHLYKLPTTGLRFFTVYGPWGRPDMSPFIFAKNIINGKPIDVFNNGQHARDFTYIDDIVAGVVATCDKIATSNKDWNGADSDPSSSNAPYRLYNIGNNQPVKLMDYIHILENAIGKKAIINYLPLQPGDVPETYANIDKLVKEVNYKPATTLKEGIQTFINWYKEYYGLE